MRVTKSAVLRVMVNHSSLLAVSTDHNGYLVTTLPACGRVRVGQSPASLVMNKNISATMCFSCFICVCECYEFLQVNFLFYYLIKLFYCLRSVFPNIRYYYVQIQFSSSLPMFMHWFLLSNCFGSYFENNSQKQQLVGFCALFTVLAEIPLVFS